MPQDLNDDSQYWFWKWLGAIRHLAITWANVDEDLCCHMASLGPNELMQSNILCSYTLSCEYRVAGCRYSLLLFTSEDRLCANLRVP